MSSLSYCSHCGQRTVTRIPDGDHLPRVVCDHCGIVHYQNPRLVVGCVPEHDGRLLLCRRAIEPRSGYWTIPAGFLENGETMAQGAAREAQEEALAEVRIGSLLAVIDIPEAHQVHVFYRATLPDGQHGAGTESLETALVMPADIPWTDIAFSSTRFALERYLADRAAGLEGLHTASLARRPGSA